MPFLVKEFFFVRHGESTANAQKIMCGGGLDTPLTALGKQQAADSALAVKATHACTIISSPLSRAHDTAQHIAAQCTLPMVVHEQLIEHKMGQWEGQPWDQTVPLLEKQIDPPEGESFAIFYQRVIDTLNDIFHQYHKPLLVSHGGFWHAIGRLWGHAPTAWARNAAVYHFIPVTAEYAPFPWQIFEIDKHHHRTDVSSVFKSSVCE